MALNNYEVDEAQRHARKLKFSNPGKFMEDFVPEKSSREMRKVNRKFYREGSRKNALYDENGFLLSDGSNLCDCLEPLCPGCHFPCPKCESEKCGGECRCNRKWIYTEIETEGSDHKILFPQASKSKRKDIGSK